VVLIPGGALGLLPLHGASYHLVGEELYFQDEFDVSYTPSALVLAKTRAASDAFRGCAPVLAGVGNPLPSSKPLAFARVELEEVASFFPGDARRLLYEEEATENALLDILPGATYVHLACHGLFDPEEPLSSHIQLAHQQQFTLRDILEQERFQDARLVVLSACQTAITDFRRLPDEAIGLPAGLLQSGAAGVVGTLWSVDDLSTALLVTKLYEYHLQGDQGAGEGPMQPAQALRRAQRWLREVTAGELFEYFQGHRDMHVAQHEAVGQRMASEVAAEGTARFAWEDPDRNPFSSAYHWAPFIFIGG
jgi:CHAT domain-containing protein